MSHRTPLPIPPNRVLMTALCVLACSLICNCRADDYRLAPEAESLALVHGCVNVVTGEFVQQAADLVVDGPSPIVHNRIYDSGNANAASLIGFGFTRALPLTIEWLSNDKKAGCCYAYLQEREGVNLHYCGRYGSNGGFYTVSDFIIDKGYTNYSTSGISGASNLHNVILRHKNNGLRFVGGSWEVTLGCGTKRIYLLRSGTEYSFDLAEEILPNGNRLIYQYDQHRRPKRIFLTDYKKKTALTELTMSYDGTEVIAHGSNGQSLRYFLDKNNCTGTIKKDGVTTTWKNSVRRLTTVKGDHLVPLRFDYPFKVSSREMLGKIYTVSQPDGRALHIDYDQSSCRVKTLSGPVGDDEQIYPFATFDYPTNHECKVFGPCGEMTRYLSNQHDHRISHKQLWSQGQLYSETQYYWAKGEQLGNLMTKALCDASGQCHCATYLTYDARHNVNQEIIYGNLTGRCNSTFTLDDQGIPQGDVEGYAIYRTYHPVYSVVLTETCGDGLFTEYRYIHGTNLLRQKLVGGDRRISREFFEYDNYANLVRHTVDNGTGHVDYLEGVTVRTSTQIEPITTPLHPAFGKPAKKWERYWDGTQERLLRKTQFHYNEYAQVIQEDIYDAQDNYCYSIYRDYDPAGRVLKEVDPLGQTTTYVYDANGNRILTQYVDQGIHIEHVYDRSNRLVKEVEVHPHASYIATHRYDHSSRKIATVDPFGNETAYAYDDLGRLTSITHPIVNGIRGVEKFEYDIAGNKTAVHDVFNHVTRTTYTARNQPIVISHPDGSQQTYQYNSNGSVAKHTAENGVTTIVYYDAYLRPARKCYFDADGNFLYDTIATFDGSYMSSETDAKGTKTEYVYDGAGRLIKTTKGNQVTDYVYDHLGRQQKIIEWADANTARITVRTYDYLDRVVAEQIEDQAGTLFSQHSYAYDKAGNRCLEETQTSQGLARKIIEYDTRHRPIRMTDPLGNVTLTTYEEDFGTGITTTTVTDPLGNQTITQHNSVGQLTQTLCKDAQGTLRAQSEFFYDLAGRKIRQIDTAIAEGLPNRIIATAWSYDSMGRLIEMVEAENTPEQRKTQYQYNRKGQKETICLPDRTQLHHRYDGLGRLQRYYASDQSFDYIYQYDLNGNATRVIDAVHHTVTSRNYDANNRMINETLANGLTLHYTYDGLGRILSTDFTDDTGIDYLYDACHLRTVTRRSSQPYEHVYTAYDLNGSLLEERSPIGTISYTQDLASRPRSIRSEHFTETIPPEGYDAVGNLLAKTRQDPLCTVQSCYTYDPLYQLQSETTSGFTPQDYTCDSLYNRRRCNNQENQFNALHQLLRAGEIAYTYDKRGNLIAEETPSTRTDYTYDALGRLTGLSRDGEQFHYQYDAFNRRLKKTGPAIEENYLYLDQNEIGAVDREGKITQLRILGRGKGAEIAAAIALELEGQILIPIHDQCGHTAVLIDLATESLVESYTYSAFGEEQRHGASVPNPWHFSSKRLDPESGWIYFGRRYYAPHIGRWTTTDPIGFVDGPNLYAYVKNSPLTHFDLYGLSALGLSSEEMFQQAYQQVSFSQGNLNAAFQNSYKGNAPCFFNGSAPPRSDFDFPNCSGLHPCRYNDFTSCKMCIPGTDHGFSVLYNHGINLNRFDVEEHMRAFRGVLKNSPIYSVSRGTAGRIEDAAGIIYLRNTHNTRTIQTGSELLKSLIAFEKARGGRVLIIAYSGGADASRYQLRQQLPEDVEKYVTTLGIAPSCILGKNDCEDRLSLISEGDWITQIADNQTYNQAKITPDAYKVKFLPSSFPFYQMDHDVMGPTYWPEIKSYLTEFYKKHARY